MEKLEFSRIIITRCNPDIILESAALQEFLSHTQEKHLSNLLEKLYISDNGTVHMKNQKFFKNLQKFKHCPKCIDMHHTYHT